MKNMLLFICFFLSPLAVVAQGTTVSIGGVPPQRPNLVLIIADDMGYADVEGFGDDKEILTPNIDRLADQGVRLTNAYVTAPICMPSRAGIITGRHQAGWGIFDNWNHSPVTLAQPSIAKLLDQAGYNTCLLGKWHLTGNDLDEWNSLGHPNPEELGYDEVSIIYSAMVRDNWDAPLHSTIAYPDQLPEYSTEYFGKEAAKYITTQTAQDAPFFLHLAFNVPHAPLQAEDEDIAAYAEVEMHADRRIYAGMMRSTDRAIGRVLDAIEQAGIAPDLEQPAFKRVRLRPQFIRGLEWAKAHVGTPYGQISSAWKRGEGGSMEWQVSIPPNTTALAELPAGARQGTESRKPLAEASGVRVDRTESATTRLLLQSGAYRFQFHI